MSADRQTPNPAATANDNFKDWLVSKARSLFKSGAAPQAPPPAAPVAGHLEADIAHLRAVNAHLSSDMVKLQDINARLAADIAKMQATHEYLSRERTWLTDEHDRLEAELKSLGAGPKLKFKLAPGMLPKFDQSAIIALAPRVPAGGTIVDVGSLVGLTASLWCNYSKAGRIVCIDPWKYEPWLESFRDKYGPITKEDFLKNVPDDRIETIQGLSPACAQHWSDPIDLYWEDGDHNNPGCRDSILFWTQFVKRGGIACGHDYHLTDVKAEVDALAARWGSKVNLLGTVWSIERP